MYNTSLTTSLTTTMKQMCRNINNHITFLILAVSRGTNTQLCELKSVRTADVGKTALLTGSGTALRRRGIAPLNRYLAPGAGCGIDVAKLAQRVSQLEAKSLALDCALLK